MILTEDRFVCFLLVGLGMASFGREEALIREEFKREGM